MDIEFTAHIKKRMKRRKIKEEEVIHAINNPDRSYQSRGKWLSQKNLGRGIIEVVYEKDKYIKIITVYWI